MASNPVFVGVWRDVYDEFGSPWNWKLTITANWAKILINALVTLVGYASINSWYTFRFIIHQFAKHENPRLAIVREQEIVVKNSNTGLDAFAQLFAIDWAWRKVGLASRDRHQSYLSMIGIVALLHTLFFGVLAIYGLSKLVESDIALQKSIKKNCGFWYVDVTRAVTDPELAIPLLQQYGQLYTNSTVRASSYVQTCYGDSDYASCYRMIARRLNYTVTQAPCPFASGQCAYGINGALSLDSGDISTKQIGINLQSKLSVRRVSTCAPINVAPYRLDQQQSEIISGIPGAQVYSFSQTEGTLNTNITVTVYNETRGKYVLQSSISLNMSFLPEQLRVPVGEVSFMHITGNGVLYAESNSNPAFAATELFSSNEVIIPGIEFFTASEDEQLTTIACVEMVQLCQLMANGTKDCKWGGTTNQQSYWFKDIYDASTGSERGILDAVLDGALVDLSYIASGSGLVAEQTLIPFPSLNERTPVYYIQSVEVANQWQTEIEHWFATSLAYLQLSLLEFPNSVDGYNLTLLTNGITSETLKYLCNNVKVHSAEHSSLSLFGIILVLLGCAFIVGLRSLIEPVGVRLISGWSPSRAAAWKMDSPLQLLRLLHEKYETGDWRDDGRSGSVPTCEPEVDMIVPILRKRVPEMRFDEADGTRYVQNLQPSKKNDVGYVTVNQVG